LNHLENKYINYLVGNAANGSISKEVGLRNY